MSKKQKLIDALLEALSHGMSPHSSPERLNNTTAIITLEDPEGGMYGPRYLVRAEEVE